MGKTVSIGCQLRKFVYAVVVVVVVWGVTVGESGSEEGCGGGVRKTERMGGGEVG